MRLHGFMRVLALAALFAAASGPAAAGKTLRAGSVAVAGLVDINKATAAELKVLPGIADAYAAAIIGNRPYRNKTQLRSKGVIPLAAYKRIQDKIVARQ